MREVCAIIRMNRMLATKKALEGAGFPGMTAHKVLGRGKQKAFIGEIRFEVSPQVAKVAEQGGGMKYIPKRMLILVVNDEEVPRVVDTIIKVNQTGHYGDGRIFVCPVEDSIRISTKEKGRKALM